jgi:hypothetical protein
VRAIALIASAALLASCATPDLAPVGAPVPAPDIRPGDAWTYTVYNGFRGYVEGKVSYVVTGVQGDSVTVQITESSGNATRVFTRSWNPASGKTPAGEAVNYQPALPLFRFPLENDSHWNETVTATDPGSGQSFPVQVQARVLGREKVQTPAGTFDAIRIERSILIGDGEYSMWRSDTHENVTEWYAPSARRSVRFQQDQSYYISKMQNDPGPVQVDWNRVRLELSEYTLAPR